MSADLTVRPSLPGDEPAILRAHARAFAHVDPAHRARSLAEWRWLFEAAPWGSEVVLALDPVGEVRGQYAAVRQRILAEGASAGFAQAVDSFHARAQGAGLARTSAFVRAGEAFAERFCGPAPEQDAVVWGLAIPSAWRTGARRLGYEHVRTVNVLDARVQDLPAAITGELRVEERERCPGDVAALFASVAEARGAIAVRDVASLDWRFGAHPTRRYSFGVVRERGELRGLGVFRLGAFAGLEGGLVCEWLVPALDAAARSALLGWFQSRTLAAGSERLIALFPDTSPEWLAFQRAGFRVAPTPYVLAARSFRPPFDRDFLFWRWHYTLADTDLA